MLPNHKSIKLFSHGKSNYIMLSDDSDLEKTIARLADCSDNISHVTMTIQTKNPVFNASTVLSDLEHTIVQVYFSDGMPINVETIISTLNSYYSDWKVATFLKSTKRVTGDAEINQLLDDFDYRYQVVKELSRVLTGNIQFDPNCREHVYLWGYYMPCLFKFQG